MERSPPRARGARSTHLGRARLPLADDADGVGPAHADGGDARQPRGLPRVICRGDAEEESGEPSDTAAGARRAARSFGFRGFPCALTDLVEAAVGGEDGDEAVCGDGRSGAAVVTPAAGAHLHRSRRGFGRGALAPPCLACLRIEMIWGESEKTGGLGLALYLGRAAAQAQLMLWPITASWLGHVAGMLGRMRFKGPKDQKKEKKNVHFIPLNSAHLQTILPSQTCLF